MGNCIANSDESGLLSFSNTPNRPVRHMIDIPGSSRRDIGAKNSGTQELVVIAGITATSTKSIDETVINADVKMTKAAKATSSYISLFGLVKTVLVLRAAKQDATDASTDAVTDAVTDANNAATDANNAVTDAATDANNAVANEAKRVTDEATQQKSRLYGSVKSMFSSAKKQAMADVVTAKSELEDSTNQTRNEISTAVIDVATFDTGAIVRAVAGDVANVVETAANTAIDTASMTWVYFGKEGESILLVHDTMIRYGARGRYVERVSKAGETILITNKFFRKDPIPGVAKQCEKQIPREEAI